VVRRRGTEAFFLGERRRTRRPLGAKRSERSEPSTRKIAHRRAEEERVEVFFLLRATTK
jgi:hypothetical protein